MGGARRCKATGADGISAALDQNRPGEVCRARDSKLKRDATVKVLPQSLERPSLSNGLASASGPVALV